MTPLKNPRTPDTMIAPQYNQENPWQITIPFGDSKISDPNE